MTSIHPEKDVLFTQVISGRREIHPLPQMCDLAPGGLCPHSRIYSRYAFWEKITKMRICNIDEMCDKVIKCERTWLKNTNFIAKTFAVMYKIHHRSDEGLNHQISFAQICAQFKNKFFTEWRLQFSGRPFFAFCKQIFCWTDYSSLRLIHKKFASTYKDYNTDKWIKKYYVY